MNTPIQTTLPKEATLLLSQLDARKVHLSVQRKVSELGHWYYEIQAQGAVFGCDWQKLRHYHEPIVAHLIAKNAIDNSYDELELPDRLPFANEKHDTESVEALVRRATLNRIADERAVASRQESRESRKESHERFPKFTRTDMARSKWNIAQDAYLKKSYFDDAVWPHHSLPKAEVARRKASIEEQLAELGLKWNWRQVRHRLRHLQLVGLLGKKGEIQRIHHTFRKEAQR